MRNKAQVSSVEETRTRLPEILGAAHHEGAVTIVTRRGEPCAAVGPVLRALRDVPKLSELRGSAQGCYGDAAPVRRGAARRMALTDIGELPPRGRVLVDSAPIMDFLEGHRELAPRYAPFFERAVTRTGRAHRRQRGQGRRALRREVRRALQRRDLERCLKGTTLEPRLGNAPHRVWETPEHLRRNGDRPADPTTGVRRKQGRPVRTGHQADGPAHGVPIIGQGGGVSAEDALEFMIARASAVGIGTALFYDPLVCVRINEGLADYVRGHDLDRISRLVGTLEIDPDGG